MQQCDLEEINQFAFWLCCCIVDSPTPCCRANWTHWMLPLRSVLWTWTEIYSPQVPDQTFSTTSWLVGSSRIFIDFYTFNVFGWADAMIFLFNISSGVDSTINVLILYCRWTKHICSIFLFEQNHCRNARPAANQPGLVSNVHISHQGKV